jgi:hypothetical protein
VLDAGYWILALSIQHPVSRTMLQLDIGNRLILRKNHACGGNEWEVWRLGMDIGLKCLKCGRKLKMPRSKLERNVREVIREP